MTSLIERHADQIDGVLGCYDRVIIQGTLAGVGYAAGMTGFLRARGTRIFDFPELMKPVTAEIRKNAERLANEHGLKIEFIKRPKTLRKEDRIAEVLEQRGTKPGLVHIFSAMESGSTFEPWHDKKTGKTALRWDSGRCLHYYFYFIDEEFGLCYVRVPTWAPFRLQMYFNAHNWLAGELTKKGVGYEQADNAFVKLDDWELAQKIADEFDVKPLQDALDRFAKRFCPAAVQTFGTGYRWSLMQVEYATDIVFKEKRDLSNLYQTLIRTALQAVKADDVARFLGRKLRAAHKDEVGSDLKTREWGTRIKHRMGPSSIKVYDKFGRVLRIETTTNDVSFFKHYREVRKKDGQVRYRNAPVRKTIYSLSPDLRKLLGAANQRYVEFISVLEMPTVGVEVLNKVSSPVHDNGRSYKGFNLFENGDLALFETLARGEFAISGFRHRDVRERTPGATTSQICRQLKNLRVHGVIKKVPHTFKYYITETGRRAAIGALAIKEMAIIPAMARN